MSDILNMYNNSTKPRPAEARNIPDVHVNFFDQNSEFQTNFTTFEALRTTEYTNKALQYYNDERANMVTPESFIPTEIGINLGRWSPENGYYNPGQPQG